MTSFSNPLGNIVDIAKAPRRIISLVPSQTELLYDLGLSEQVVGITKFCVHPESWFRTKTRIGGTKDIKKAIVHSLKPDLIIANKEENRKEQVEELMKYYPVWVTDVNDLEDALSMIGDIGKITGSPDLANAIIKKTEVGFSNLKNSVKAEVSAAYLIWQDPYMAAGGNTFIHDMMSRCGFENIFSHIPRYPAITIADIQNANCKLLLLSSEPYPFRQKHLEALQQELLSTKIILVDGEMFSWYGSRLISAPHYFTSLVNNSRHNQINIM